MAWFHYRREDALGAEYLTRDQVVEMAKAIVELSKSRPQESPLWAGDQPRGLQCRSGSLIKWWGEAHSQISKGSSLPRLKANHLLLVIKREHTEILKKALPQQ